MKIVITGGSGFIGKAVARELCARGFDVTIFDYNEPSLDDLKVDFFEGSILDQAKLKEAINGADVVYHFAALADIGLSTKAHKETLKINILGTMNLLEVVAQANIKQFIFASTMYVYNDLGSFYGASKKVCETIIQAYAKSYNFPFTMLRFGSLYGPGSQQWNGVRKYIEEIVRSKKIEYIGDGEERREYVHIADAARLSADVISNEFYNRAVTITGQQVLTSSQLLTMIFEICGFPVDISFSSNKKQSSHYKTTPYQYAPLPSSKLVPLSYIDIGQGILEVVEEVSEELKKSDLV